MMNRAVLPEWRDRNGTLYTPVRRTAAGVEYRRAAAHEQRSPNARGADDTSALADKARALGFARTAPAPANGLHSLSPDRSAPSLKQLEKFRRVVSSAR